MEHLYAIRGWVEGDSEIIDGVRKLAETSPLAPYWHFSTPGIGKHGFAFLGAVVKGSGRGAFEEHLRRIAAEVDSNLSDIHENARGYFHVACLSASEQSVRWRIGGGVLAKEPLGHAD